jgi:hypothetical protein
VLPDEILSGMESQRHPAPVTVNVRRFSPTRRREPSVCPSIQSEMNARSRQMSVAFAGSLLLSGCSAFGGCSDDNCAQDRTISANISAQFAHYPSLTANTVRIQTLNRVVYLTGLVDTDVERLLAVSVAGDVQGVTRVVDSISVNNVPR